MGAGRAYIVGDEEVWTVYGNVEPAHGAAGMAIDGGRVTTGWNGYRTRKEGGWGVGLAGFETWGVRDEKETWRSMMLVLWKILLRGSAGERDNHFMQEAMTGFDWASWIQERVLTSSYSYRAIGRHTSDLFGPGAALGRLGMWSFIGGPMQHDPRTQITESMTHEQALPNFTRMQHD